MARKSRKESAATAPQATEVLFRTLNDASFFTLNCAVSV